MTDNGIQFVFFLNGKEQFKWLEISPDGPDPDTYYTGLSLSDKRKKSLINSLVAGSNQFSIKTFLYNHTAGDAQKVSIGSGSFEVVVSESELAQLKEEIKPKRSVLSMVTIYNGLNQSNVELPNNFSCKFVVPLD